MEYRYVSHTVFNIEYHFVWVTKYRYHVLTGEVALKERDILFDKPAKPLKSAS